MVRIFVTEEAFEAIKATLPVGSMAFEPEITKGLHHPVKRYDFSPAFNALGGKW
jgi:hypothetical protein